MVLDQSKTIKRHLSQISDMLLLNGTLTECPGLVNGKTGIAIFFFHYAQYTNNVLFADYAMDLINETFNQIHVNSSADYEKGIAGIGVGVDYMIKNEFLVSEEDICEDLDQRMIRAVMYDPWQDFSMYDGLTGYGKYWISRLRFPLATDQAHKCLIRIIRLIEENFDKISKEEQTDVFCFLYDLHKIPEFNFCDKLLEQSKHWNFSSREYNLNFSRLGNSITGKTICLFHNKQYYNNTHQRRNSIEIPDLNMDKPPESMGILSGYAGEGLTRLTSIKKIDHSWTSLL